MCENCKVAILKMLDDFVVDIDWVHGSEGDSWQEEESGSHVLERIIRMFKEKFDANK